MSVENSKSYSSRNRLGWDASLKLIRSKSFYSINDQNIIPKLKKNITPKLSRNHLRVENVRLNGSFHLFGNNDSSSIRSRTATQHSNSILANRGKKRIHLLS